jgi:hypothetical protein
MFDWALEPPALQCERLALSLLDVITAKDDGYLWFEA